MYNVGTYVVEAGAGKMPERKNIYMECTLIDIIIPLHRPYRIAETIITLLNTMHATNSSAVDHWQPGHTNCNGEMERDRRKWSKRQTTARARAGNGNSANNVNHTKIVQMKCMRTRHTATKVNKVNKHTGNDVDIEINIHASSVDAQRNRPG